MQDYLIDNKMRRTVLASCVTSLTDILDEVHEVEGLNVDYEVLIFTGTTYRLGKKWKEAYRTMSGGTNIFKAVKESVEVLNEEEIDGNKIMVIVTDGDVCDSELEDVKDYLLKHNSEIKAMIIGIGARTNNTVFGENNILCLEHADQIIMEAIQDMLE